MTFDRTSAERANPAATYTSVMESLDSVIAHLDVIIRLVALLLPHTRCCAPIQLRPRLRERTCHLRQAQGRGAREW